jgi:hypothetical protein
MSVDPAVAAAANTYLSLPMNFGEPTNLILIAERDAWVAAVEWLVGHPDEYARLSRQTADEWEYAIKDGAGLHAWPFGPQDEELADTLDACVKALDGNDPDFWNPDDHIVRRRKHGPWEPAS